MKHWFFGLSIMAVLLLGCGMETIADDTAAAKTPVIVELFTSEGCSSCPPAEKLLSVLAKEAKKKGQELYILAYHVDYWDYLGWKDRFSSKAMTRYQRRYALKMRQTRMYTPQMIVQGRTEFVGSNASKARATIKKAIEKPLSVTVTGAVKSFKDGSLTVTFKLSSAPSGSSMRVAVTEDALESKVTRGENSGETLKHAGVVRAFSKSTAFAKEDSMTLKVPADVKADKARIILYLQNERLQVLGAASIKLKSGD